MGEILSSFMIISRNRVKHLKKSIDKIYTFSKYPDTIECFLGIDNDDLETLNFIKTDEIFKKHKGIRSFSGPRVGFENRHLFFKELFPLTTGDIILPWADDNFIFEQDWEDLFLPHKDKALLIGWKARWLMTRNAVKKYQCVRDFVQAPHCSNADTVLGREAVREGFYLPVKMWWSRNQPVDKTQREGRMGGWLLQDKTILDNFKLEEI